MTNPAQKSPEQRFRALKGIVFIAGGAAALTVVAYVLRFWSHPLASDPGSWGQFGDYVGGLMNPFIAFLAFAAVVLTVFQNEALAQSAHEQAKSAQEALAFDRSARQLDAAISGMVRALELLKDGNNDRVTWIQAARILAASQRIAEKITEPTHKDMLEVALYDLRVDAQEILGHDNAGKSAAFFYGSQLSQNGNPIDADVETAARKSSLARGNAPHRGSDVHYLDERTLFVVWEFAQYPESFADPIGETNFDDLVSRNAIELQLYPGLRNYLEHRQRFRSIGGKLIERPRA